MPRIRYSLCIVLGLAWVGPGIAAPAKPAPVLMISLDGMKPEYVTQAARHGLSLLHLQAFLTEGSFANGVVGVIPTVTYPSHTTMITGVWPGIHGISANTLFDPEGKLPGAWYWYYSSIKVPTLIGLAHDHGLSTASIGWPVTIGAPADELIAEYAPKDPHEVPHAAAVSPADLKQTLGLEHRPPSRDMAMEDETRTQQSLAVIKTSHPTFMLVHLINLDHQEHLHSPFSPAANKAARALDAQVGRLIAAEHSASPDARIIIVSDHGFVRVDHNVALNLLLAQQGLLTISGQSHPSQIVDWTARAWISGGSAFIMVKNPSDPAQIAHVAAVLDGLAKNSAYGIARVLDHTTLAACGANPDASFVVEFAPGWSGSGALDGAIVKAAPSTGTHGYLPDRPELRSMFMAKGTGIAKGRNLGVIDMRQIAPTIAALLGFSMPSASLPALPLNTQP